MSRVRSDSQARHAPVGPRPEISQDAFGPYEKASPSEPPAAEPPAAPAAEKASPPKSSLLKSLTTQLTATYRKTDPSRPAAVDDVPRRVLTQPSVPAGNR